MEDEAYEMRETESWEGWCGERKKMRKERVRWESEDQWEEDRWGREEKRIKKSFAHKQ